jgi:hypothetical protein
MRANFHNSGKDQAIVKSFLKTNYTPENDSNEILTRVCKVVGWSC